MRRKLRLQEFGEEQKRSIICVDMQQQLSTECNFGMLYNFLYWSKLPFLLRAKLFQKNIKALHVEDLEIRRKNTVRSYNRASRVLVVDESLRLTYGHVSDYMPHSLIKNKERMLADIFEFYFEAENAQGHIVPFSDVYKRIRRSTNTMVEKQYALERVWQERLVSKEYQFFTSNRVARNNSKCFSAYLHHYTEVCVNGALERGFYEYGIKTIGLYGFGVVGRILYKVLEKSEYVRVLFIADENAGELSIKGMKVVMPQMIPAQRPVDAIVVTPVFLPHKEIMSNLRAMGIIAPVIPLEFFVYNREKPENESV